MFTYEATLLRLVDGDTLWLRCDLGFRVFHDVDVRLAGLNAPELHTVEGEAAKLWVQNWFTGHPGPYIVHTDRDRTEKYGRYLATVVAPDGHSLTADLLADGIAQVYNGGPR